MPNGYIRQARGKALVKLGNELDNAVGRNADPGVFRAEVRFPREIGRSQKPTAIQLLQANESQKAYPGIDSVFTDRLAAGIILRSMSMQQELSLTCDGERIAPDEKPDRGEKYLVLELDDDGLEILQKERDEIISTFNKLAELGQLAMNTSWPSREPDLTIAYFPQVSSATGAQLRQESLDAATEIVSRHLPLDLTLRPASLSRYRYNKPPQIAS